MHEVKVKLGSQSYPIYIEPNSLSKIGVYLKKHFKGVQVAVISDQIVSKLYADSVVHALRDIKYDPSLIVIPNGEASKSVQQTEKLYTELLKSNFCRDSCIIALGGGVIGDLAGFAAATFLRGIPFIQVPTTLLAQVDSSVGGKVGINHSLGKNLIGSFYQPKFVLIDPNVLKTLDKREIWAGLGEVVKYGLIRDSKLFNLINTNLSDISGLKDIRLLSRIIERCCRIKAEVVRRDEKETSLRRILNFGHTLGHSLEANTDYAYFKHGEAIIYGMHWAAWVSKNTGYIQESDFFIISDLLNRFPVPDLPKKLTADNLIEKIKIDKKQSVKGLHLILINKIGDAKIQQSHNVTESIKGWLDYVRQTKNP